MSFLKKINHLGEQKVSGLSAGCIVFISPGIVHSLHLYVCSIFHFPQMSLVRFLCFIHFNFIVLFSPFFHLIPSRTNTNCSLLERFCHSVVPHFVFIVRSGKPTFRARRLQSWNSCCCCFETVHCSGSCMSGTFTGLHTHSVLLDSHPHLHTPTCTYTEETWAGSALPSMLCQGCIVSCHLSAFLCYCTFFSVMCGLVGESKVCCSMKKWSEWRKQTKKVTLYFLL